MTDRVSDESAIPTGRPAGDEPFPNPPGSMPESTERLEDYLDFACAPLVGRVPYSRRQELRAELRSHLEALADSYVELGHTPDTALVLSLRQFGDPTKLGKSWVREWSQAPELRAGEAFRLSFISFLIPSLIVGPVLYGVVAGMPPPSAVSDAVLLFLVPLVAGMITGWRSTGRQPLAVFYALSLLTLCFVPFQTPMPLLLGIAWLPAGCVGAAIGSVLRRRFSRTAAPRWMLQ
jgi:hypothetical protein